MFCADFAFIGNFLGRTSSGGGGRFSGGFYRFSTTLRILPGEAGGEPVRHALLAGGVQMAVDVGGGADIRMTHPVLHVFQGEALIQQEAGAGMPK